jgi:hypothetical protein
VSRAKPPRLTRESVEQAVESLKGRIKEVNKESEGKFTITEAVAFGDFLLSDRPRVQPADVGIGLARRGVAAGEFQTASDAQTEGLFLRQLRGKTAATEHQTLRRVDEQKVPSQLAVDAHMRRSAINRLRSLPAKNE